MTIRVSHFIGLSGIGGVQKTFFEYMEYTKNDVNFLHKVYTLGKVDAQYKSSFKVYNIANPKNIFSLALDLFSHNRIVHFYNNLSSLKVAVFLLFVSTNSLIVHERGTVWNIQKKNNIVLRFIVWKSALVLANSNATKAMLELRHSIPSEKIQVIYNGINPFYCQHSEKLKKNRSFKIGFIGRFDAPKGIHVLIDSMKYLSTYPIELNLAGDGILKQHMIKRAGNNKKIKFLGRVGDLEEFYKTIDLLVVPSIREPFGNICVEAGFYKTPVLAANIDGIPEIIENGISGELVTPTDPVSADGVTKKSLKYPKKVINPDKMILTKSKQINPKILANRITSILSNPDKLRKYSLELYKIATSKYTIKNYINKLHAIYARLANSKI
jgi:glycosyltransferase involved in cell wall biosynthesis